MPSIADTIRVIQNRSVSEIWAAVATPTLAICAVALALWALRLPPEFYQPLAIDAATGTALFAALRVVHPTMHRYLPIVFAVMAVGAIVCSYFLEYSYAATLSMEVGIGLLLFVALDYIVSDVETQKARAKALLDYEYVMNELESSFGTTLVTVGGFSTTYGKDYIEPDVSLPFATALKWTVSAASNTAEAWLTLDRSEFTVLVFARRGTVSISGVRRFADPSTLAIGTPEEGLTEKECTLILGLQVNAEVRQAALQLPLAPG